MQKSCMATEVGTPFQRKVWAAIAQIPKGKVMTYAQLARAIGSPSTVRAVAGACGANPWPYVDARGRVAKGRGRKVPCHRVVRSDGGLGGYSGGGGVTTKKRLLIAEGALVYVSTNK